MDMADDRQSDDTPTGRDGAAAGQDGAGAPDATRRRALMLGATAVSAIVTVRPAIAATAASVLNCTIPVPEGGSGGSWIDPDGRLVPPQTRGAFPPASRPFTGEDVKAAMRGRSLPGTSYEQNQAYLRYIRRLQRGQSGFTCFASLQMPR